MHFRRSIAWEMYGNVQTNHLWDQFHHSFHRFGSQDLVDFLLDQHADSWLCGDRCQEWSWWNADEKSSSHLDHPDHRAEDPTSKNHRGHTPLQLARSLPCFWKIWTWHFEMQRRIIDIASHRHLFFSRWWKDRCVWKAFSKVLSVWGGFS